MPSHPYLDDFVQKTIKPGLTSKTNKYRQHSSQHKPFCTDSPIGSKALCHQALTNPLIVKSTSLFASSKGYPIMKTAQSPISHDFAQEIAIQALAFLASDSERLVRLFRETGLDPLTLRKQAHTPATLAAILEHLLGDESLLLVFCASCRIEPDSIAPAHLALSSCDADRA